MPPRRVSVGAVVFALLVVSTLAAFAWSQRLKRDPLVLDRVSFAAGAGPGLNRSFKSGRAFTPNRDCRRDVVRIRFRVTRSDDAHVQVVKPGGKLIVTLAREEFVKRYRFSTFYWDGRVRNDGKAPPGRYKLRVKLLGQDRTLVPGGVMRLHDVPRKPTKDCPPRGLVGVDQAPGSDQSAGTDRPKAEQNVE